MKTPEQVREEFDRQGISIRNWAKFHGYTAALVYQVLKGNKPCRIGMSHEIAVRLGLKDGVVSDPQKLTNTLSAESPEKAEALTG